MKYNYFQDEKLEYEEIEIPDELLLTVRQTVAMDRRKKAAGKRMRMLKAVASVAAVLFLCLTIGVNSSYAFAEAAVKIPIVKSVAKAVVIRSYRPEIIAVYEENKVDNHAGKTPVQQEDQPVMSGETVSGSDAPAEEEETEIPAQTEPTEQESEPEQVLTGIEAWKAEMSVERLKEVTGIYTPEMETKYADTPERLRTILLAQLPGKDIALYGYHEDGSLTGVLLLAGDECQYFDWNYMKKDGKLPELTCADIDGDGKEEITVFLYHGEETKEEAAKESITALEEAGAAGEKTDAEAFTSGTADADTTKTGAGKKGTVSTGSADSQTESGTQEKTEKAEKSETADKEEKSGKDENLQSGSTKDVTAEQEPGEPGEEEKNAVSGNDVERPAEKPEKSKQQPGEIWVVCPRGEKWPSGVLFVENYEKQIFKQLKIQYDEKKETFKLYLAQEPSAQEP